MGSEGTNHTEPDASGGFKAKNNLLFSLDHSILGAKVNFYFLALWKKTVQVIEQRKSCHEIE